jgi:hypothetical protein
MSLHFRHTLDKFNSTWMEGRDNKTCKMRTKESLLSTMVVNDDVGMFDMGDSCEEILQNKVKLDLLRRNKKRTSSSYDIKPFRNWIIPFPAAKYNRSLSISEGEQ